VEKAERETIPQHNDDLIDLDPVPPKHFDSQFGTIHETIHEFLIFSTEAFKSPSIAALSRGLYHQL
ncbi:hypothetical protein Tco_1479170, partial [Tanacetum coccineum]